MIGMSLDLSVSVWPALASTLIGLAWLASGHMHAPHLHLPHMPHPHMPHRRDSQNDRGDDRHPPGHRR